MVEEDGDVATSVVEMMVVISDGRAVVVCKPGCVDIVSRLIYIAHLICTIIQVYLAAITTAKIVFGATIRTPGATSSDRTLIRILTHLVAVVSSETVITARIPYSGITITRITKMAVAFLE